ncbi:hypothetical protein GGI20_004133 [Coemansia sp. BCRC 34301]|nr:hypothetical protein GGI20_004133 [Coemansia sp. BCRC 34301]
MSYIPRPPVGRADELWIQPNGSVASSTLSQSRAATRPNSHRLPPSTRTSVVRVIADGSPLPNLPPIPGPEIAAASASFASTTRFEPPASLHRRTASAGDELKHASKPAPSSTLSMDFDVVPSAVTRLRTGLGSLRLGWAGGKAKHASKPMSTPWSADEVKALADTSLRYWKSGSPVDFDSLSADLGRPPAEVSDMLEYLLMGYSRFGPTSCWAGESNRLISDWAAIQFPSNSQLCPAPTTGSPIAGGMSRIDACISALKCRPRLAARTASHAIADHGSATSGQNIVTDFREGLRLHNSGASSPPPFTPHLPTTDRASKGSKSLRSEPSRDSGHAPSSTPGLPPLSPPLPPPVAFGVHASDRCEPRTHRRTKSTASQSPTCPPVAEPSTSPVAVATLPVFTGGLRGQSGLNTLSRLSRARKLQQDSFRRQSFANADTPVAGGQNQLVTGTGATLAPVMISSVLTSAQNTLILPEFGLEAALRPRANAVAAHPHPSNGASRNLVRDSRHVELPNTAIPTSAGLDDAELHSNQSSYPAIGITQTDSDVDALFADLSQETRQKIRHFVEKFIADFPADFKQRVEMQRIGKDGLCITVDHFADFMYDNDAYLKAIETVYRHFGGSVIYTCNVFFHVQLLHAVRLDRIPITEDNWLRANEFATKVFNKRIEDARFIVFQAYEEGAANDSVEGKAGGSAAGARPSSVRGGQNGGIVGSATDREGNEHSSQFENAFYMDKQARRHVRFLLENHSEEILKRAREHGPQPMPVALQVDETTMLPFDVEIRNALITFIWEDMPHSRVVSKEITLLRALELLNGELADRCGFYRDNLRLLLDKDANHDVAAENSMFVYDESKLNQVPGAQMAQVLGTSFARQFFAEGQLSFLEAMLHDHPFRPITRDELKEWIAKGASPFGDDIEFQLNTKLYKYLKGLRVRPSSKQWLSTSAAATLSMLRRTLNATRQKKYLAHIDIEAIAAKFREIEQDLRGVSESTLESSADAQPQPANRLSMTAFGKVLSWVAQISNTPPPDSALVVSVGQHDARPAVQAGPVGRVQPTVNGHYSALQPTALPPIHYPSYGTVGLRQAQPAPADEHNSPAILTTQPLALADAAPTANPGEASMAVVLRMFGEIQTMVSQLQAQKQG